MAKGILAVVGDFNPGDMINVEDIDGRVLARGLSHFSSQELLQVAGLDSAQISALFPGRKRLEVIHRDSLALLQDLR
ncbi:MAG: hypothetical protein LR015_13380 [Verrucomicrobia bacterium]|nr:hypothetical protein [Verrucomicrobiota bacterium]